MTDTLCRITVVGERRRIDLAVPTQAPILEYAGSLAALCAMEDSDLLPAEWSLGLTPEAPLPPERSLAELGFVDGQLFYLCDALAAELPEPEIREMADRVAQARTGWLDRSWDRAAFAETAAVGALLWITAVVVVSCLLITRHPAADLHGSGSAALPAILAGVALPPLGRLIRSRLPSIGGRVAPVAALCAVPCLAAAARTIALTRFPATHPIAHLSEHGASFAALALGALIGSVLAVGSELGTATAAAAILSATAVAVTLPLALFGADPAQISCVVAATAYVLIVTAPAVTVRISTEVFRAEERRPGSAGSREDHADVRRAVGRAMRLLTTWTAVLSLVEAAALVTAAWSGTPVGYAVAAGFGVALLLRSGGCGLVAEVAAVATAGASGLFALVLRMSTTGDWKATVAALLLGAAVLWRAARSAGDTRTLARPHAIGTAAALFGGLGLAAAVLSLGVLAGMTQLGRGL